MSLFANLRKLVLLLISATTLSGDQGTGASWHLEAAPRAAWVLLGGDISVNCLNYTSKFITFASDIGWFKITSTGTMINRLPTSLDVRVRSNGHQLQIFKAEVDDEGLYCCMPVDNVTQLSNLNALTIVNVSIAQPPVIVVPVRQQIAKIGDVVLLQCHIAFVGKPAATGHSWQKSGSNLGLQSPKYSTAIFTDLFILIIHNVTERDEGLYSCFLINSKYQKDNESIYLQVHVPAGVQNGISLLICVTA